ncbi:phosphoribosyl-ATP pyrophosphohydrolase [Rhodococcus hoagii]|nr:phosphoribosyl-ATP pyrophosphohydrolase [Prescottella equi]
MGSSGAVEFHRKLVRDNIPDVILANGDRPHWRPIVDDSDYLAALLTKVVEEAKELQGRVAGEPNRRVGRPARGCRRLMAELGMADSEVKKVADRKRTTRGGFTKRIWLDHVEMGNTAQP